MHKTNGSNIRRAECNGNYVGTLMNAAFFIKQLTFKPVCRSMLATLLKKDYGSDGAAPKPRHNLQESAGKFCKSQEEGLSHFEVRVQVRLDLLLLRLFLVQVYLLL